MINFTVNRLSLHSVLFHMKVNIFLETVNTVLEWLTVALDYRMAVKQTQPAFIIRHLKVHLYVARINHSCCEYLIKNRETTQIGGYI